MAIVTTTVWDDSVKTRYGMDFDIAVSHKKVHGQFARRRKAMGAQRGSAIEWPIYELMAPATSTLDQSNDVTPQTSTDNAVNIPVYEYGNARRHPVMLKATAYTDTHKAAAELIAQNVVDSTELVIRTALLQGTRVFRPLNTTRVLLGTATAGHDLSTSNLNQLAAHCRALGVPGWGSDNQYAALLHPALAAALLDDSAWLALAEYSEGATKAGNIFAGEIGQIAGFRFTVSNHAKVYWGGALPQASAVSTTLNGAVAAGATSIILASGSNVVAGSQIRLGDVETADTEVVLVTDVTSSPTFTVQGFGNTEDNVGCKYAHATGAAAVAQESAGVLMVIGDRSLGMVYSDITGPDAKISVTVPSTVIPNRFTDFSWHLIAGWKVIANRYLLRAEFPLPQGVPGYYEG